MISTLREAIGYLQKLSSGQRAFYKQVCRIAQLILVMSATNVSSEKSFSTMKRVKSLNHLMTPNIYKNETEGLDLKQVANEFIRGNEHCMRFFGNFS